MSLPDLEKYILQNKHLPNIPSENEIKAEGGFDVGAMNIKLLEKIEELALYVIKLNKDNETLHREINQLKEAR
jgi:hypothetical protein